MPAERQNNGGRSTFSPTVSFSCLVLPSQTLPPEEMKDKLLSID